MADDSSQSHGGLGPVHSDVSKPGWWRGYPVAAAALVVFLGIAIWLSTLVGPNPATHDLALFAHLGFLVLGMGAVLTVDYFFALWFLGRTTFVEALASTARLHVLVWSGLVGMVISGALLRPDLTSGMTILKLAFVAALALNGVQATALGKRLGALDDPPSTRLLLWGGLASAVSQICWWGAFVIGFLTVNQ